MSNFPEHWDLLPLEDVMEAIIDYRGKTPKKTESGVPLITAKIVKNGRIETPSEFIAEDAYDDWMVRGLPEVGDVVVTTEAPLGEVAQLDDSNVALAQRIVTLRGKKDVLDNDFLLFLMQSKFVQEQLEARASGSTVRGIKQSELRKVTLVIPPVKEQIEIANHLKTIDNKIELNRQINQTLEQIAQAIFKFWFVDFEPVKAKIEAKQNGQDPERAAMRAISGKTDAELDALTPEQLQQLTTAAALFSDKLVDSELGEIPKGWEIKPLSQMIELIGGGTPKRSEESYWGGDIPWFSVKDAPAAGDVFAINTAEKITELGLNKCSTKLLPEGVTIISARGTVGRLAMVGVPMAMNQSCYGVKAGTGLGPAFNYFNLKHTILSLQQQTHGAVFDTITTKTFSSVYAVQPCVNCAKEYEIFAAPLLRRIKNNLFENSSLIECRDLLLPKLLSGELTTGNTQSKAEAVA